MAFKQLAANRLGRDILIGDLHGSYDLLLDTLARLKFDPLTDRVISVGDLIDRGPQSLECLGLLTQPWFHAVLGNHELMLLRWLGKDGSRLASALDFLDNGGKWVTQLNRAQYAWLTEELVPLLLQAPAVISVNDPVLPYNVVHAEARRAGFPGTMSDAELRAVGYRKEEASLQWGRGLLKQVPASELRRPTRVAGVVVSSTPKAAGLGLTYVGHTVLPEPLLHMSHVFIDGGACLPPDEVNRGGLVAVDHHKFSKALLAANLGF